jgi:hypothetical protein
MTERRKAGRAGKPKGRDAGLFPFNVPSQLECPRCGTKLLQEVPLQGPDRPCARSEEETHVNG